MKLSFTLETGPKAGRAQPAPFPARPGPPPARHGRPERHGKKIPLTRAEVLARRARLDLVLASDAARRQLVLASPGFRHDALRGASRRQVRKLLAFARRWLESLEQRHARFAARRFRRELLAESRDELMGVAADSMLRDPNETDAAYGARVDRFVAGLRPRLGAAGARP